jgi:hypothetical protein
VNPPGIGVTQDVFDEFDTKNEFHGGEVGVILQECRGRWTLELVSKLALGSTRSTVEISGSTLTTIPNVSTDRYDGGFLALDSNRGFYEDSEFAVVPEVGLTVTYALAPRLKATFGYNFIYWSKVARVGDQIDRDINTRLFPPVDQANFTGPLRPEFNFVTTDFWAQGLHFGLDYRF